MIAGIWTLESQGGLMLSLQTLTLIVSLCQISALEDNKSKWTELKNVEKYQLECRVWYMDCIKKEIANDRIEKCMRKRLK